jgi:hypothetical protein
VLAPARKVRAVLVTSGNPVLENFMKTAAKVGTIEASIIAPSAYGADVQGDLFIFDGFVPSEAQMPKADALIIRPNVNGAGEVAGFKISAAVENPAVLRWKREDPLMQYVELGQLHVSKALLVEKDADLVDLVSSPESSLIGYKDVKGSRRYLVAFSPLTESDWWREPSLLIFLQNVVEQTRVRHFIGLPQMVGTGTPASLWDVGDEKAGEGSVRVTGPGGDVTEVRAEHGTAEFGMTDKAGFYEVESGGKKMLFAANLLNAQESEIGARSLQAAGGGNVQESASVATVNKEIWQWFAMAALVVLVAEWWVYHRRIA